MDNVDKIQAEIAAVAPAPAPVVVAAPFVVFQSDNTVREAVRMVNDNGKIFWEMRNGTDRMGAPIWVPVECTHKAVAHTLSNQLATGALKVAAVVSLFALILSGCFTAGDQANRQQSNQGPVTVSIPVPSTPPAAPEGNAGAGPWFVKPIEEKIAASSNANQQSLSGLGLQVAKIGENVEATGVKIESTASAVADIRNDLKISAKLDANLSAIADLKATFNAKVEALAAAQTQAGMNNTASVERINETLRAGGNITQFPPEVKDVMLAMQKSISDGQSANTKNLQVMAGILATLGGAAHLHNMFNHKRTRTSVQGEKKA